MSSSHTVGYGSLNHHHPCDHSSNSSWLSGTISHTDTHTHTILSQITHINKSAERERERERDYVSTLYNFVNNPIIVPIIFFSNSEKKEKAWLLPLKIYVTPMLQKQLSFQPRERFYSFIHSFNQSVVTSFYFYCCPPPPTKRYICQQQQQIFQGGTSDSQECVWICYTWTRTCYHGPIR